MFIAKKPAFIGQQFHRPICLRHFGVECLKVLNLIFGEAIEPECGPSGFGPVGNEVRVGSFDEEPM